MYRLRPTLQLKKAIKVKKTLQNIGSQLKEEITKNGTKYIALEAFPGIDTSEWVKWFNDNFKDSLVIDTDDLYFAPDKVTAGIQDDLTSDEVYGRFSNKEFTDFLDPLKVKELYNQMESVERVILIGVGASRIIEADFLVYLDIARWEVQLRYRAGMLNWKGHNEQEFSEKLKRGYYFDWEAAKRIKDDVLPICHYFIDANVKDEPKMVSGANMRQALKEFTHQPFQLRPYFDSGVWGGNWMQEKFNVEKEKVNLAWCFDGVPEENSILMVYEDEEMEMPAYNLVSLFPKELLGVKVFGQFGRDYPIRFNFLDTMGGQNLSLQVHPTLDYAYRNFRTKYTQDESYYVMDCKEGAVVYLGVKEGVNKEELVDALEEAKVTGEFDEQKYINIMPVKKHDHYLIPGGTIHSSGENSVVLEISTTPNRFTFKLWDWGRLDLDGKPRPISLHHGKHVINTDFDSNYVREHFYNRSEVIKEDEHSLEEHTGLHELEPIETRRLTFTKEVTQSTELSTNMLKLVEGEHIQVVSPTNSFDPYDIYYGETFIIPEQVKDYVLIAKSDKAIVMKAYIR